MSETRRTRNLIDMPVGDFENSHDCLDIEKYVSGLAEFIKYCRMPTTIAIQGEWGSGKTSMMNLLKEKTCRNLTKVSDDFPNETRPFYGIWINVWKHSLMKTPEMTLLTVLSAMTEEIINIMNERHKDGLKKVIGKLSDGFSKFAKFTATLLINGVSNYSGLGTVVHNSGKSEEDSMAISPDIIQSMLKDAIKEFIEAEEKISSKTKCKPIDGFVFFIDDLDRMEPSVAVSLLELLKNIFEVPNCIFVMAIDYDVVVRGLKAKFGDQKISADNERQYRSFFDKIIQLPFNMPQRNYNIKRYLQKSLESIGYFDDNRFEKLSNDVVLDKFTELVKNSTGPNPRSIIRLINSLSLIDIMQKQTNAQEKFSDEDEILSFGLICMQIAYPKIYRLLQEKPNFNIWEDEYDEIVRIFDLKSSENAETLKIEDKTVIDDDEEEQSGTSQENKGVPWNDVIDAFCEEDVYLRKYRAHISNMLEIFAGLYNSIGDENLVGERIDTIMAISAVTSVSSEKASKSTSNDEMNNLEDSELEQISNQYADPVERYCALILNRFKNAPEETLEKAKKTVELCKFICSDLKEKYKELITFDCKGMLTISVVNKQTSAKIWCQTYDYKYIRLGKISLTLNSGNKGKKSKSYSSEEEFNEEFYLELNEAFNKLSAVNLVNVDGTYKQVSKKDCKRILKEARSQL